MVEKHIQGGKRNETTREMKREDGRERARERDRERERERGGGVRKLGTKAKGERGSVKIDQ